MATRKVVSAESQPAAAAAQSGKEEKPLSPAEKPENNLPAQTGGQTESDNRSQILRGGAGNVDKIRDILFGTQMRDYESRFGRLEETLIKETMEIRETNRRRFEQLEAYMRKEFEAIQTRIKSERDERTDVSSQHSRELKDLGDSLSRRIRDLDDRGNTVERDLRNDLLQQARDLTDEIRARHDEIASLLEKRFHELSDGKTDRAALANLFNEVALRLSDQFRIPGSEE